MTLKFITTAINYLITVGNTSSVKRLIKQGQLLPQPIRGEFMTAAEQLEAIGMKKGEYQKAIKTAINLKALRTLSNQQIADVTELPLEDIEKLN